MTDIHSCSYYCDRPECIKAQRDELRERLAQPEQEPVAWIDEFGNVFPLGAQRGPKHLNEPMKPLYVTPPQRKPEQEPVAWEDVLGAIARGWTHDDNKHKTMDVQLAVAIAKEIQDMVTAPPQRKPPQFPTMLRKMWSGSEVQQWINENWSKT